ncbi:protein rep [Kluyvera ascorbata]|uniref:protein rep n=1 Tax=Kluyvera ascorbata TaxID=51288 RepID=UPI002DBA3173|nr:protein rep [Kluyvera ascorbata]MEB6390930.1 protein rep [Kluyvera ascorbata]
MSYGNNKAYAANVNLPKVPFLPEYANKNGDRLNERKGKSIRLAKLYYLQAERLEGGKAEAMKKRAGRVFGCSSHMEMAIGSGGYGYNLYSHRCKDRSCTTCQRVRAFVLQSKIREITPELIKQTNAKDGLIFGTLTIKNPPIKELKDYLKILSKSFTRLMRRKEYAKISIGGFRCFEVTRGESGADFCHPHIHFLLQVKASYFARNSPLYINSDQWATAWTDCLKLEVEKTGRVFNSSDYPSGKAFVKILRVQAPDYTRENRKYATVEMLQNQDQIVNYVLKYTAKEDENSKKALVKNDPWFFEYDKQIKNIRAISFFGIYKKLISELPPREYNEKEIRKDLNNNQAKFYSVLWDDEHKYIAIETTEEEALNKKRTNTINSIKTTLIAQLESKNYILDIMIAAMNKGDFLTVNEEINNHNILADRTYKTFKRMEKAGELEERKSGFYQPFHDYTFKSVIYEKMESILSAEELENIKKEIELNIEVIEDNPPF